MTASISSVVLRARPEKCAAVRGALAALPNVEIHADCGDGRFVLVIEKPEDRSALDVYTELHHIDGVLAVSLVYHYWDVAHPQEFEA